VPDHEFLEQVIELNAPGWNWRDYINDGKPRYWKIPADMVAKGVLPGKILLGPSRSQRNPHMSRQNQIAQEEEQMARYEEAWRNRFVAPDQPDIGMLNELRRVILTDPASWPALRDLKMATAIPERALKTLIAGLCPTKGEIVIVERRRRFAERGAWPKRYAPRLVIGVLKEFAQQAHTRSGINHAERARMLELTTSVVRSLAGKISRCRRTA
jgi:hypothetical protein